MSYGSNDEGTRPGVGRAPLPAVVRMAKPLRARVDWKRISLIGLGPFLFFLAYFLPWWPLVQTPAGQSLELSREGRAVLGLFLWAGVWWGFEVVPIGVTAVAVAVLQALFQVRKPSAAFRDFMDPAVWFILGSLMLGMVFTKTGLSKRISYRILILVGERTSMIYLGLFLMIGVMTMVMAHTTVAAAVFPLLMAIHSLYEGEDRPTQFGRGLFMGLAFSASAGSIITMLGSARAIVALGFFQQVTGRQVSFLRFIAYMLPLGLGILLLNWLVLLIKFRPEKKELPGLRERAVMLHQKLGPLSKSERRALVIIVLCLTLLAVQSVVPGLEKVERSALLLFAAVLFFLFDILKLEDLEEIPLNILLLFGGAMSLGYCLLQTGAGQWLALEGLALFPLRGHGLLFLLLVTAVVMALTNFVINVAVIALVLPVALLMAREVGVSPELALFCALSAAGLPFLLLIGAAPNAIAYGSRQFTSREFFWTGVPASLLALGLIALFAWKIWPVLGMPVVPPAVGP